LEDVTCNDACDNERRSSRSELTSCRYRSGTICTCDEEIISRTNQTSTWSTGRSCARLDTIHPDLIGVAKDLTSSEEALPVDIIVDGTTIRRLQRATVGDQLLRVDR